MGVYQANDLKKPSGGRKWPHRKVKRKYWMGRYPILTRLSSVEERRIERVRGGNIKVKLKRVVYANILDPQEGVVRRERILAVVETPANPHFARGGIITKGAIIETSLGKARVTSRPGQDGVVNAILVEKRK